MAFPSVKVLISKYQFGKKILFNSGVVVLFRCKFSFVRVNWLVTMSYFIIVESVSFLDNDFHKFDF